MKNKEQFDYFNNEWIDLENQNEEEISDDDFVESYSVKQKYRQKENINDLTYKENEVCDVYIYPLYTLNGKKIEDGLRISRDKITIMATTIDKVIPVRAYLADKDDYDLVETMDPSNPLEQLMRVSDNMNFYTDQIKEVDFGYLYLLTKEKITENNFSQLKQYLGKVIIADSEETGMEMSFSSLEEFSSNFKTSPIRVVLSEPIKNKIKEIHVTSPKGTLIGNIKPVDENGRFPELIAKPGTEIFPKLCFPFQTSPVLSLVDYWSSDQIIPLNDIFNYLDSIGKKYNDDFFLQGFLVLGGGSNYPEINYENLRKVEVRKQGRSKKPYYKSGGENDHCTFEKNEKDYDDTTIFENKETFESDKLIKCRWQSKGGRHALHTVREDVWDKPKILSCKVTEMSATQATSGFASLCQMLTESFWKDYEFKGATKIKEKDGQPIEIIENEEIFILSQKYAGQDRYAVTTNEWLSWKKINIKKVNENLAMVKRIENAIPMLSGYIKSNFSINKGDNDDYKILLPYYFELQNQIDNPNRYASYSNIEVKLKSNYFEFTSNGVTLKNNCISNNLIHKLDYNHYAFPELTSIIETASIPSSMPLDQQTANGEYSKYQVKCFAQNSGDREKLKNHYGNGVISFNPLANNATVNDGEFQFFEPKIIEEIKLSAFFGYGLWRITLVDQDGTKFNLDLRLFDKNDSTISFINLIL